MSERTRQGTNQALDRHEQSISQLSERIGVVHSAMHTIEKLLTGRVDGLEIRMSNAETKLTRKSSLSQAHTHLGIDHAIDQLKQRVDEQGEHLGGVITTDVDTRKRLKDVETSFNIHEHPQFDDKLDQILTRLKALEEQQTKRGHRETVLVDDVAPGDLTAMSHNLEEFNKKLEFHADEMCKISDRVFGGDGGHSGMEGRIHHLESEVARLRSSESSLRQSVTKIREDIIAIGVRLRNEECDTSKLQERFELFKTSIVSRLESQSEARNGTASDCVLAIGRFRVEIEQLKNRIEELNRLIRISLVDVRGQPENDNERRHGSPPPAERMSG